MGASQSNRKITLINDEKSGVIKLSENLAFRLRGQLQEAEEKATEVQPPPPAPVAAMPPPPPPVLAPILPPISNQPVLPPRDEGRGTAEAWTSAYADEARKALLRLQSEQDEALAAVETTWRNKMMAREKQFAEAAALSMSVLEETAASVEASFSAGGFTRVCGDCQAAVQDCYQRHPTQTLRCADLVEKFTRCVDLTRLENVMPSTPRQQG